LVKTNQKRPKEKSQNKADKSLSLSLSNFGQIPRGTFVIEANKTSHPTILLLPPVNSFIEREREREKLKKQESSVRFFSFPNFISTLFLLFELHF
jgi:hypothetical protein